MAGHTERQPKSLPQKNNNNHKRSTGGGQPLISRLWGQKKRRGEKRGRQATTGGARSVLLLPSINSPPFLPPYIGAIRSKKREKHQGPSAPVQDPHLPERVLGWPLPPSDHLQGYAPPPPSSPFPFSPLLSRRKSVNTFLCPRNFVPVYLFMIHYVLLFFLETLLFSVIIQDSFLDYDGARKLKLVVLLSMC